MWSETGLTLVIAVVKENAVSTASNVLYNGMGKYLRDSAIICLKRMLLIYKV